jgi:hypothetical protein
MNAKSHLSDKLKRRIRFVSDFVLAQFAVLIVQFVGIPLLLLSVLVDECLSRLQTRAAPMRRSA